MAALPPEERNPSRAALLRLDGLDDLADAAFDPEPARAPSTRDPVQPVLRAIGEVRDRGLVLAPDRALLAARAAAPGEA